MAFDVDVDTLDFFGGLIIVRILLLCNLSTIIAKQQRTRCCTDTFINGVVIRVAIVVLVGVAFVDINDIIVVILEIK